MVGGYMRGVVLASRVKVCEVCLRALSATATTPRCRTSSPQCRVGTSTGVLSTRDRGTLVPPVVPHPALTLRPGCPKRCVATPKGCAAQCDGPYPKAAWPLTTRWRPAEL